MNDFLNAFSNHYGWAWFLLGCVAPFVLRGGILLIGVWDED